MPYGRIPYDAPLRRYMRKRGREITARSHLLGRSFVLEGEMDKNVLRRTQILFRQPGDRPEDQLPMTPKVFEAISQRNGNILFRKASPSLSPLPARVSPGKRLASGR